MTMLATVESMPVRRSVASELRMEVVAFTPELSKQWLDHGRPNRQVVRGTVETYARVMREGGWRVNGEPLIVNSAGRLMNGQHRLHAVIEADVTVNMLVVFGVSDDAFDTIDVGRIRMGRDAVSVRGYVDHIALAAAAGWLWKYERCGGNLGSVNGKQRPTNHELIAVIEAHPGLVESALVADSVKRLLGRGIATFGHYLLAQRDKARADKFFENLSKGEGLREGQSVYVLREVLIANRQSKRKMTQHYQIALLIRAFNYERAGRVVKNVRWRQRGDAKEAFPTLD